MFDNPDVDFDKKALEEEESRRGGIDWSTKYWKPSPDGKENLIRIMPAKRGGKFSYHMRIGKHFIKHEDRTEAFVCMKETYGLPCPACENNAKLYSEGKEEEAGKFRVKRYGVFNIIDRKNEAGGTKLYESPVQAVWKKIVGLIASRGRLSNLLDEYDDKGGVARQGRDISLTFNPNNHPQYMYEFYPCEPSALGTPEQIVSWTKELLELDAAKLYPPVDYEIAKIKTFGSKEERDALRELLKQEHQSNQQQSVSEVKKEEPKPEPKPEQKPEPKVEQKVEPKVEPKPESKPETKPEQKTETDAMTKVREKIEAIRARQKK